MGKMGILPLRTHSNRLYLVPRFVHHKVKTYKSGIPRTLETGIRGH